MSCDVTYSPTNTTYVFYRVRDANRRIIYIFYLLLLSYCRQNSNRLISFANISAFTDPSASSLAVVRSASRTVPSRVNRHTSIWLRQGLKSPYTESPYSPSRVFLVPDLYPACFGLGLACEALGKIRKQNNNIDCTPQCVQVHEHAQKRVTAVTNVSLNLNFHIFHICNMIDS